MSLAGNADVSGDGAGSSGAGRFNRAGLPHAACADGREHRQRKLYLRAHANLPGVLTNIGNCELTHTGTGFGSMMNGVHCVLYMKQLDFLLLALDQLANTMQLVRAQGTPVGGSFTIAAIVCDQGLQGPQSSFQGLNGICSTVRADGFAPVAKAELERIIAAQLLRPGFRILAFSQRLFGAPVADLPLLWEADDQSCFQFASGRDATIACFSFTLDSGAELAARMAAGGRSASLYSLHPVFPHRWERVCGGRGAHRAVIVFYGGKETLSPAHKLAAQALLAAPGVRVDIHTREEEAIDAVSDDRFAPPLEELALCR